MAFTDSAPMTPPMGGPPMLPPMPMLEKRYDIKVKRCVKTGSPRIEGVAPEDFMVDPEATVLDEKVRFVGDRTRMTRSEAKQRWPDKEDIIDRAPAYTTAAEFGFNEKRARDNRLWSFRNTRTDKATEEIEIYECFPLVDYDGDGIAERRKVCMVARNATMKGTSEDALLSNEEWGGDHPYCELVPQPMPHRRRGRSLFDDVADIQRVKTVLMRGMLDNVYVVNNPMLGVNVNAIENMDALTNPQVGQIVSFNGPPGDAVIPIVVPYVGDKILQALEYKDMEMEKRTGVSRSSMALDTDTLQYQTAEAVKATRSSSYTKVETMARNIAEYQFGLRVLFAKLLKLFVENQKSARYVRSGEQVRRIDPRGWNAEMKVSINIGLGAGSREQDLATLGGIAQKQELFIQASNDPTNPIVNIGHLLGTYRRMVEIAGLKSPEQFFPEVTQEQVMRLGQAMKQNQQPPPEVMLKQQEIQGNMQIKGMELQQKQKSDENRAVLDQRQAEQKAQLEQVQATTAIQQNDRKFQAETAMDQQRLQADLAKMERQFQFDKEMALLEFRLKAAETRAGLVAGLSKPGKDEMGNPTAPDPAQTQAALQQFDDVLAMQPDGQVGNEARMRREAMESQRDESHQQTMMAVAQSLQQLAAAMLAPSDVVRDQAGRVVGTQKRVN